MMEAGELAVHIAGTAAFIAADPVTLTLQTRSRLPDGAGGSRFFNGPDRAPQTFRLIPQQDKVPERQTSDGIVAVPEFVLLGMPDCVMQRYDRFEALGATWEIAQVHLRPAYQKKGDVVRVI